MTTRPVFEAYQGSNRFKSGVQNTRSEGVKLHGPNWTKWINCGSKKTYNGRLEKDWLKIFRFHVTVHLHRFGPFTSDLTVESQPWYNNHISYIGHIKQYTPGNPLNSNFKQMGFQEILLILTPKNDFNKTIIWI